MDEKIEKLKEWIDGSDNIVIFGGAGVSTESGIPDFRSQDGLYNQEYAYPPETILSHTFFMRNPKDFIVFTAIRCWFWMRSPMRPTGNWPSGRRRGRLKAVITQNIDASIRRPEARKFWSFTAASTGITACAAANFSMRNTCSGLRACRNANAAASSSRTWSSMRKGWTCRWFPRPSSTFPG